MFLSTLPGFFAAIDAAMIVGLFVDIITAVMTGVPSALVSGFEALVSDSAGTGFSLLAIWLVVIGMFYMAMRLVFALLNKVRA